MVTFSELSFEDLVDCLQRERIKPGHARGLWQWYYRSRKADPIISKETRTDNEDRFSGVFDFSSPLQVEKVLTSRDESRKLLLRTRDDQFIETVFIPQGKRRTLCLSSQLGCPWGCRFCATGSMGFKRNLSAGEMVSQMMVAQRELGEQITNLVFMGMGEPLSNIGNLRTALSILSHPSGLALPPRRITVSTIGILESIEKIISEKWKFPLAVSLHHHDQGKREELMPATRGHSLRELTALLERYTRVLKRVVFFEYLLLEDINDSLDDAAALVDRIGGIDCRINLIHFHPFAEAPFRPSNKERESAFYRFIQEKGIPVIFRKSRGDDIRAACGQLAGGYQSPLSSDLRMGM